MHLWLFLRNTVIERYYHDYDDGDYYHSTPAAAVAPAPACQTCFVGPGY